MASKNELLRLRSRNHQEMVSISKSLVPLAPQSQSFKSTLLVKPYSDLAQHERTTSNNSGPHNDSITEKIRILREDIQYLFPADKNKQSSLSPSAVNNLESSQ